MLLLNIKGKQFVFFQNKGMRIYICNTIKATMNRNVQTQELKDIDVMNISLLTTDHQKLLI